MEEIFSYSYDDKVSNISKGFRTAPGRLSID